MHSVDLAKWELRTDLVFDNLLDEEIKKKINYKMTKFNNNIVLEEVRVSSDLESVIGKRCGSYKMISFLDITDTDNYKELSSVFVKSLKSMLDNMKFNRNFKVLVVGLGNYKSTADSIGPKVLKNILVTGHLFLIGDVSSNYSNVSVFEPFVTGETGIDTKDLICSLNDKIKPDLIIFVDALATSSIDRVNKSIQISDSGINPGSGVSNSRGFLDKDLLGCHVIVIGVPTVMDSATIVSDTINFMFKKFSYLKGEKSFKDKLKISYDYTNCKDTLSDDEKKELLGIVGTMGKDSIKKLIFEVLDPIKYNFMVTTKEIDFFTDRIAQLIGQGINSSLHNLD